MNELLQQFPTTDDPAVMELWARLDCQVDETGNEWYAAFTIIDGIFVQITPWEGFEGAWESYTALFLDSTESAPRSIFSRIFNRTN